MRIRRPLHVLLLGVVLLGACETVTVITVAVSSVQLSPSEVSLLEGGSVRLTATLADDVGNALSGRIVIWTTDHGEIAAVDGAGTVSGIRSGVTSIRAEAEGVAGVARVVVLRGPTVALSRSSVEFLGSANGPRPDPVIVAVFNDGAGQLDGLAASVDYGAGAGGWLIASLANATAPTTLTVAADAQDLPQGVYAAVVTVTANGSALASLTVTFTVTESAAVIGLSRESVSFTSVTGSPRPAPQSVSITNEGSQQLTGLGAGIRYEDESSGWLIASLSPTTAPSTLTLSVDPGSLATGEYRATVQVSSAVALNSPRSVAVSLRVENPPPEIALGSATLNLSVAQGSGPTPPTLVPVTNGGGGALTGLQSSTVYQAGASGWLNAVLQSAQAPTVINVVADPSGLASGTYVANVFVSSPVAANSPQILSVTLVVASAPPLIALSPSSVELEVGSGGGQDQTTVSVTNGGSTALTGLMSAVEYDAGDPTGWLSAVLAASSAPTTLQLTASGSGLPAGTYGASVRVSAPAAGNSPQTVDVTFTVGSAPTPPSGLTAVAQGTGQVDLEWNDNSSDEDQFRVERRTGAGAWSVVAVSGVNAESAIDLTVLPGTTYTYRVRACRTFVCSAPSNEATATTASPSASPDAPSNPTAIAVTYQQVDVAWTDNAENESSFELQRSINGGAWTDRGTTGADETSYSDASVQASTTYRYRIRACNAIGCSEYTSAASATTPAAPSPPSAPSGATANATSPNRIDVTWTDNSDNETSFEVERRRGSAAWTTVTTTGPNLTSYSDEAVAAATEYQYRVRACNGLGCSAYSGVATATTPGAATPPAAVSDLSAMPVSTSRIDLTWKDNSDNEDRFEIEWRRGTSGNWRWSASVAANVTSFSATGLRSDRVHQFRVRACNDAGCSSWVLVEARTLDD